MQLWRSNRIPTRRPRGAMAAVGLALALTPAVAGVVYETATEFLASGDFNGDGVLDVLVLDKATGNARVGYQDPSGALTWSAPQVTGVESATGCAVGRFLQSTQEAVAATSPGLNQVNLVDLSHPGGAGAPVVVTPGGVGPHTVVGLPDPLGGVAPAFDHLLAASSFNDVASERLDLLALSAGAATAVGQFAETGPFARGNALQLGATAPTLAVGLVRGTADTLHLWQFTNAPAVMLALSNLPPGSDYAFGRFNLEPLPRFLFYVPGGSNVTVVALVAAAGNLAFAPPVAVALPEAIQQLVYLDGNGDGSALVQFGDGVAALRLPGGAPVLSAAYRTGAGTAGATFTGLVPLAAGNFALFDAPGGDPTSAHTQVLHFNGTSFSQVSASSLPPLTSRGTRANVWLFQAEPFVNRSAGFVSSLNAPDWTSAISGLPGGLAAEVESDGGASAGLGHPVAANLGTPPAGAAYALPNQYRDVISLFSLGSPRPPEPVTITILPPPGLYTGPIQLAFTTLNPSDQVFYRVGGPDTWHLFTAPFLLTNDATVEFYGTNPLNPLRSALHFASYSLGQATGQSPGSSSNPGGGGGTNTPPASGGTNGVLLAAGGTVFYSQQSPNGLGTIWAINLDGSGETYITTGEHPRVSRDGRWMAFWRPQFAATALLSDLWLRDMQSGQETLFLTNVTLLDGYDWDGATAHLIVEDNCSLWAVGLTTPPTALGLPQDCGANGPVVNPVDGRLAFHVLGTDPAVRGLYVASTGGLTQARVSLPDLGPRWPEWSPDGTRLVFADGDPNGTTPAGTNLWLVGVDGSGLNQISSFIDGTNGFPYGALWSPVGPALVGAGTVFGTNGLWVIPLTPDGSDCAGPPHRLPTSLVDTADFAGTILVAPPSPVLGITVQDAQVMLLWPTNASAFILEVAPSLPAPAWTTLPGPYSMSGSFFEYRLPPAPGLPRQFFRLRQTRP